MEHIEEKNDKEENILSDKKNIKKDERNGKKDTNGRDRSMREERKGAVTSSSRYKQSPRMRRDEMSLFDTFDRFLDDRTWVDVLDAFRVPRMLSRFDRAFFPRVNVSETENEIRVVADVPGIDPDAITVEIRGNRMRLKGSVEQEVELSGEEEERPHRFERMYGSFHREFSLPAQVKEDKVRATYKDGVLTITAPKVEEEKHKRITIEKQ